ncbi:hypothetical protein [Streptomyces sp. NPDC014006]
MTTHRIDGQERIFRPTRQYARMGVDSIAAVVIYLLGIAGLATIAT